VDKHRAEEHVAILKQRLYTKRLPTSFNILDHSIDQIEKMLIQPAFHADQRATLSSRRLKTIAQFKYDLISLEITTAEELTRSYTEIIVNEKQKLTVSAGGQVPLPTTLIPVLNAIAVRQSNIIKRTELLTKYKVSFFDDAPMVIEEEAGTIGAIF
jgi:hypothetical protein